MLGHLSVTEEKGLLLVCRSVSGHSAAQLRDGIEQRFISGEAAREKCKKRDRNFKGRICRRERKGEKKLEKSNVPRQRERERGTTMTMTLQDGWLLNFIDSVGEHDLVGRRQFTGNGRRGAGQINTAIFPSFFRTRVRLDHRRHRRSRRLPLLGFSHERNRRSSDFLRV